MPFVHFFDGFRTSHELNTVETLDDDVLRALVPEHLVREHRARALSPEHPFIRGTAQNPDVYFQARETVNPRYDALPGVVQATMDELAEPTGRRYGIVEYSGHPEATRVIVVMGSGGVTARETAAVWPPAASASASCTCASTGPSRPLPWSPRCPRRWSRSPSSTGRRSPGPTANRCSSTSWPRSPRRPPAHGAPG